MKERTLEVLRNFGLLPFAFALRASLSRIGPRTLIHNVPYWMNGAPDGLAFPSARARFLVSGSSDLRWFLKGGELAANVIAEALQRNGIDLRSLRSLLDFGCGSGRVLRHWKSLENTSIHGTDQHPLLVEECRRTLPFVIVTSNGPKPPLGYPDNSFDLVYALSVFTHLNERQQDAWRDEIRRILKPGGIWLFTTHGEAYISRLSDTQFADFKAGNVVCRDGNFEGQNICVTYHPASYVHEKLAAGFSVLEHVPEGAKGNPRQDLYLLRKI
jgi:SAM-dependent methyltransferase